MTKFEAMVSEANLLWEADRTWGTSAVPRQIDNALGLTPYVMALEHGAKILNLGAGIFPGVEAELFSQRPDLCIVRLDTGYRKPAEAELDAAIMQDVLVDKPNLTQQLLVSNNGWRNKQIAALTERIPVAADTFDFTFAHAVIPEHLHPDSYDIVLSEISRVMRLGSVAVLGPYNIGYAEFWQESVERAQAQGLFQRTLLEEKDITLIDHPYLDSIYVGITTLSK